MADIDASAPAETGGGTGQLSPVARALLSNEFGLIVLVLVFAWIFTGISPAFMSKFSVYALGRTAAIDIMIGFSMMVVIITGGLNLSVGAIGVCAAMTAGWLMQAFGLPWIPAIFGGIAMGAALGAVNGLLIVRTGLHSFIITLATMSIFYGVMIFLTQAESFREIDAAFAGFGRLKLAEGYLSPLLVVSVVVAVLLVALFRFTALGREMLAAGANPRAAELSGIRVDRMIAYCHVLSGALAAVAGVMLVARNGAAIPSMAGDVGQNWLLPAFLGPVLGGTLLTGGRISVLGTLLGALLVTLLNSGLLLMQVGAFWIQTYLGLLLLAAVLMDMARRRYLARRKLV